MFPDLICSNTFGGSLPITGNGGGTSALAEFDPIWCILRESIVSMRT
jgi:hypothetical protein